MCVTKTRSQYYKDVGTKEVLTAELERTLFAEYKHTKDIRVRNRIVEGCLRFVIQCAHKHNADNTALDDLISAGNIGLLIAVDRFDIDRGTRFLSYAAHWISLYMRNEYDKSNDAGGIVRIPTWKKKAMRRVTAAKNKVQQKEGRQADNTEVCTAAKVSEKQLAVLESTFVPSPDYSTVERKLTNSTISSQTAQPSDRAENKSITAAVIQSMDNLNSVEKWVLKAYYGFENDTHKSLRDIGASIGCTSERVRQLKARAMGKVKKTLSKQKTPNLEAFV